MPSYQTQSIPQYEVGKCIFYSVITKATLIEMTVEGVEDTKEAWIDTASGKYPFTFLLVYLSKKRGFLLCFTPPENEFGNSLFRILCSSSTFRLFNSYESKKVSGKFPDEIGNTRCRR